VKTVILCGGMGTRLREETEFKPKPMIEVGNRPILWHIMKHYYHFGFNEFILCLGYKGEIVRHYFLNYKIENHDLMIGLKTGKIDILEGNQIEDWIVTLADTGLQAMTGARVKRIAKHLRKERFFLTYGDGVSDVNLKALLDFHRSHGKIVTLTGVKPPGRFGELNLDGQNVTTFLEKPAESEAYINGGFFVCEPEMLDYLSDEESCFLERAPLERLAKDGQLMMFPHKGFWQCVDTFRDYQLLQDQWKGGRAPWKIWE
jgi:glucose-1-phosphate cytidylyltransferase